MKTLARVALVLVLGALAAPAYADQSPVQRIILQEQARKNDPRLIRPPSASAATTVSPIQRIIAQESATRGTPLISVRGAVPATTAVQVVEVGGFHWADAGIGAAVALGLLALAAGALLVHRLGRPRSA
jgi:hypothetical protein